MKLNIKKQKIGSTYYDVEEVDDLRGDENQSLSGRIFQDQGKILINKQHSYQQKLHTLLHEDTHGLFWEYTVNNEEELVEVIANAFYALIVDNPKFIQKILDYTKELKK